MNNINSEMISVIMGIKYQRSSNEPLKISIDSILTQSYTNFELIICERDSTASAKELLKRYAEQDQRVILIDGGSAHSFSEQLNICLKKARGKWIARMDDDDYSFPERLEKQLAYLQKHNEFAFAGCRCKLICDGENVGTTDFPASPQVSDFLFSQPYIHPSLLFRRSALESVKGYSQLPRCNRNEDYDILLRIYENGMKGCNMDEVLFAYTIPSKGITNRNFKDRLNETKTRYVRYRKLKLLPKAFPYVIKPIAVWLLPKRLLSALKSAKMK